MEFRSSHLLQNKGKHPMADYRLQSALSAIELAGAGITRIPPGSQLTVVPECPRADLPPGTTVVVWEQHKYAVFAIDLQTKALHLA